MQNNLDYKSVESRVQEIMHNKLDRKSAEPGVQGGLLRQLIEKFDHNECKSGMNRSGSDPGLPPAKRNQTRVYSRSTGHIEECKYEPDESRSKCSNCNQIIFSRGPCCRSNFCSKDCESTHQVIHGVFCFMDKDSYGSLNCIPGSAQEDIKEFGIAEEISLGTITGLGLLSAKSSWSISSCTSRKRAN